jgi:hypothetical protein
MKVICPHTRIAPQTRIALDACGYPWQPADVSGRDTAYTELLQKLWRHGETLTIVEHDIVPRAGAMAELEACERPWCAFTYPLTLARGGILHAGLGCVRFSAALLEHYPTAVDDTLAEHTEVHPTGHWCALDHRLARALTRLGAAQHVHTPPVGHLHPVPSHGCA